MNSAPFAAASVGRNTPVYQFPEDLANETSPDSPPAEPEVKDDAAAPANDTPEEATETQENPLIEEAVSCYGLSREEAERLGDNLSAMLARLDQFGLSGMAADKGQRPAQEPANPSPQPAQQPQAEQKFELLKVNKIEDLGLDPDDFDEKMVGAFNTFKERINSVVDALAQRDELLREVAVELVNTRNGVQSFTATAESQAEAEFTEKMDQFIAGLGEEFKPILGEKPMRQLSANSPLVRARQELAAKMNELQNMDVSKGRPQRSVEHYASAALRLLHPDQINSSATRKVEQQVAARRRQAIAAPSNRTHKPMSADERALAVIKSHPFLAN